jgi:hypothetical protein
VKHGTTLAFKLLLLVMRVPIRPNDDGWRAWEQANLVAPLVLWRQASGLDEQGQSDVVVLPGCL